MSSEPPFPAPKGMEWDPTKRRFFKVDQKRAKVEIRAAPPLSKNGRGGGRGGSSRACWEEEHESQAQGPIEPAAFAHNHNEAPATFASADLLHLRSGRVASSSSMRYRSANIASRMGGIKYRESLEIDFGTPTSIWSSTFAVDELESVPELGALIWITTRRGSCLFVDSGLRRGKGTARAGVRFGPQHWRDPSQYASLLDAPPTLSTNQSRGHTFGGRDEGEADSDDEEERNFYRIARIIDQAQIRPHDTRFTSFAHHRGLVGSVLAGEKLWMSHMEVNKEADQPRGFDAHPLHVSDVRVTQPCGFAIRKIEGSQKKGLAKTIVAVYGLSGRVGYIQIADSVTKEASVPFQQSDVFHVEILPSGKEAWLLCRNGSLYRFQIARENGGSSMASLSEEKRGDGPKRKKRKLQGPVKIPNFDNERIVAFRIISEEEVLVMFETGELRLSSTTRQGSYMMTFQPSLFQEEHGGHRGRSLAVDKEHRLFALGGNDGLTVWSLDRPLAIGSCRTYDGRPCESVTFCPRSHIARAELQGGSVFLPRGLPAIATAGRGRHIRFYE